MSDFEERLCDAYRNGQTMRSISCDFGVSCTKLSQIFRKYGVKRKIYELDLQFFESNKDKTKREISEMTGVSLKRVGYLYRLAHGKKSTKGKTDFSDLPPSVDPNLLFDRDWLSEQYLAKKFGTPTIAKMLGTKATIIFKQLEKFGIPKRTIKEASDLMEKRPPVDWLLEHYIKQCWSISKCAAEFGVGFTAIYSALRDNNIQLRNASEQHVGDLNEFYGKTHTSEVKQKCIQVGAKFGAEYWITGDIEAKKELTRDISKQYWASPERRAVASQKIAELCKQGKCNPKSSPFWTKSGILLLLRSSWEEAVARFLDNCPAIKSWSYEDVIITFSDNGEPHQFVVDFKLVWIDEIITLIECKNKHLLDQESEKQKIIAMEKFCKEKKYECLVISDKNEISKILLGYQERVIWSGSRYSVPRTYLGDSILNKEAIFHEIIAKVCPWPHLTYSDEDLINDLSRLKKESLAGYQNDEIIRSTAPNSGGMPGRKIMTHFQPHFWSVAPKKRWPLPKAFDDKQIILDCLKISCSERESLSFERLLREINFHYPKYGRASHFAPGFARVIIKLMDASRKRIFDPCCGWGGRLLGAWLECCEYCGFDLSPQTVRGLSDISNFLNYKCDIRQGDCLQHQWPECDLIFTSPPFYDTEEYVGGDQPWMKLRSRDEWIEKFVSPFIQKLGGTATALYLDKKTKDDFETVKVFNRIITISNRRHARRKKDAEYLCIYDAPQSSYVPRS